MLAKGAQAWSEATAEGRKAGLVTTLELAFTAQSITHLNEQPGTMVSSLACSCSGLYIDLLICNFGNMYA